MTYYPISGSRQVFSSTYDPFGGARRDVRNRIDVLNDYATSAYDVTTLYMGEISEFIKDLEVPLNEIEDIEDVELVPLDPEARPELGDLNLSFSWPDVPIAPVLSALPAIADVDFPAMDVPEPDWVTYEAPTVETPTFDAELPTINAVDIPASPSVDLPDPPTLDDLVLPDLPEFSIPEWDAELPDVSNLDEPDAFSWGEPAYLSDIWADLLAKVLADIRNGGTGLNAAVEAEIFQRHLDRVLDENEKLRRDTEDYFASRGFELPPGALVGTLAEVAAQAARNNARASRDITISQAELAQKNTHFILDLGTKLETLLRQFYADNTNRSLQAAKEVATNSVEIYKAKVQATSMLLERYKTQAQVYETRVRATLAAVEVYKAQLEGVRIQSDIQKTQVSIYTAQIGAAEALLRLYVSEMQGAKIASEIELTKLELYKAQVTTYSTLMEAEKIKVALYEAQLSGEKTKAGVYQSRLAAKGVEADIVVKRLTASLQKQEAALNENHLLIDQYKSELTGYDAQVRAEASRIGATVDGYKAETSAYSAETGALESYYKVKLGEQNLRIENARHRLQKAIAEMEAVTKGYEAIKTLQLKGQEGIMNVGAQLTASALNAVNASVSFGLSESESRSTSKSSSESLSESHNFDYEV